MKSSSTRAQILTTMSSSLLTKDTVIKTNVLTIISVMTVIVGAFVSYTLATNRIQNNERAISNHEERIDQLEDSNIDIQKLLVEISTDVKAIKERQD